MAARKPKQPRGHADDDVGYGKPPAQHRFPPGVSGNPKGRPKGTKNLRTDLAEELTERVRVTENGRPVRLSKQRLVLKALMAKAIKGDTKAATIVIGLVAQTMGLSTEDGGKGQIAGDDDAILSEWLAYVSKSDEGGREER